MDVHPSPPAVRHHIHGSLHADAPVSGIDILVHRCARLETWSLRAASNAFWRMYWPLSLGGHMTLAGVEHPMEPGFLYLISPHTPFHSGCTRPFSKWYFHFNLGGPPRACRPGIVRLRPDPRMRGLLNHTCPPRVRPYRGVDQGAGSLEALELVLLALQHALPRFGRSVPATSRLAHCAAFLGERMKEKVTLAELACFSCMSARSVSNLFTRELGFPPMRYLLELRLNHAMKLLRHSDQTIEQIATECGFPNRYYLTRMLAKYRKITPAAFRKQVRCL